MTAAIFCTSHIDINPQRYYEWAAYYSEKVKGIDLWMINDGPVQTNLDLKSVRLATFDKHLGRNSIWSFPGWKRSFRRGLELNYDRIGHIESDCYLTDRGLNTFVDRLKDDGYFTGYCVSYTMPEASLQIINNCTRDIYLDRYKEEASWYEELEYERWIREALNPVYMMMGDRIEGRRERYRKEYDFLSAANWIDFVSLVKEKPPDVGRVVEVNDWVMRVPYPEMKQGFVQTYEHVAPNTVHRVIAVDKEAITVRVFCDSRYYDEVFWAGNFRRVAFL